MSKKLLSLVLAVVMLVLAVPAVALPVFAAEEDAPAIATVKESFSTKTDYTAKTLLTGKNGTTNVYDDTAYFIRWYESATSESYYTTAADVIPETAVAKINPALIEKGIVSADDSFTVAFNKWVAYVQEASSITFKENWAVGSIDAANVFTPLHDISYSSGKTAFNLKVRSGNQTLDSEWDGNHFYVTKVNSDGLFKGMYNRLSQAISASTQVKDIAVPLATAVGITGICGYAYQGSAMSYISGGWLRNTPGTTAPGARLTGVQWTSTYTGYAKISLDLLHRHSGAETAFGVMHNGNLIVNYTNVTDAATANAAIGDLEIPVFPGDTIALVFGRTATVTPTLTIEATVEVDTSRMPPETWTGSEYNATMGLIADDSKYFFAWYDGGSKVDAGVSVSDNAVGKVNPTLIEMGIISSTDTVKKAFDKWVDYMKQTTKITYNGAWEIDNVYGTKLAPIAYHNYYNNRPAFVIAGSAGAYKTSSLNDTYWVTEEGIDRIYAGMWNCIVKTLSGSEVVSTVEVSTADAYKSVITPHSYQVSSTLQGTSYTLRPGANPNAGYTIAYTWTSHGAGCAKITFENISGGNAQYTVAVNGVALMDYQTLNLNDASALETLNETIAALEIPVFEGDKVSVIFARNGSAIGVKGAVRAELDTEKIPVAYKRGETILQTFVVKAGDALPELTGVSSFGTAGYLINGKYAATLPETVEQGLLIEDYTIRSSTSITINNRYIINVYVQADEDATGAGVIVNGRMMNGVKQEDGSWKVIAMTVPASKLQSAVVTYKPFQTYADGYRVSVAETTVSAMDLLNTYITGNFDATTKALAQGVMDYAEALRAFMTNVDVSADVKLRLRGEATIKGVPLSGKNEIYLGTLKYISTGEVPKYISANQDQTFVPDPTVTEADKVKMGFEEGVDPSSDEYKYAIKDVTLNMETQIGFAFRVVANGDNKISDLRPGGLYAVKVSSDVVDEIYYDAFLYEGDDRTTKAIVVDGVPASRYDQDMEFTIVEKQADGSYVEVSATLTYSVKAYAVQTYRFGDWGYKPMLAQALFRLGVLADEYVAAHA
ncbi:MAG: hypothetical protein IJ009_01255 [Clostridia bacterium]|nr:hypothetical protein [Clostridia bacterium]